MTLLEALRLLDEYPDDHLIYVERDSTVDPRVRPNVHHGSSALVASESPPGISPRCAEDEHLTYLLEVSTAKEVLATWSAWRNGRLPSPKEMCDAVIHYGLYDAYIPVEKTQDACRGTQQ